MTSTEDTALCALCGDDTGVDLAWAAAFPGLVCTACEARAVSAEGEPPAHDLAADTGENPVFIDEKKCWRRYREGGYVTMLDRFDCESLEAYLEKTKPEAEPADEDEEIEPDAAPAGDVAATITALRSALAGVADERELLASLKAGLERLRTLYRQDRTRFDAVDLGYLKGVARIVEALAAFVAAIDGPAGSRERLRALEPLLAPFAVGRRVAEELRAAGAPPRVEPVPEAPRCPRGHRMVVRRGLPGRRWECSRYPECEATREIEDGA